MTSTASLRAEEAPAAATPRPLRVAALVNLTQGAGAGGHVKCWERLAQAALGFEGTLDLTIYFMGPEPAVRPLGRNVRYAVERPVFATERMPLLSHVPDHTDLAPWHARLARQLPQYDVIHTTDAYFAFARTALGVARRTGIPLVTSVHTDTPRYARVFTAQTVERVFGTGRVAQALLERLGVARYAERRMLRQLERHQRACQGVLVSRPEQLKAVRALRGGHAGLLRRGIDRSFFTPEKRDRDWLAAQYGIAPGAVVIVFAGRVNRGKNVMVLADAVTELAAAGAPVHLFCAGAGEERSAILARLPRNATCPGSLEPETLARVYASTDIFAFPSAIEEYANVVLEALASGLPVLVAGEGGMERVVSEGETGFVLPGSNSFAWSRYLALLAQDSARREAMGARARRYAETRLPTWADVLGEDILPTWHRAYAAARQSDVRALRPAARPAS
ncbi:MAG TPA: glycosyltransferase [Stellaceae bacterium]|nr:glycosyltransferase [Stellaceae bacterium]